MNQRLNTFDLVEPVFDRAWRLRNEIATGSIADFELKREELKDLLMRIQSQESGPFRHGNADYLGLSYPLACWVDELMTEEIASNRLWNENKLEGDLFGTNDRAWMFWRQAELAETLGREDDVRVFYSCVGLGFTGQYASEPGKLAAWMERTRVRIGWVPELTLPFANDLAPATDVPPLHGNRVLNRASHVGWAAAVMLLPLLSYFAVTSWAR